MYVHDYAHILKLCILDVCGTVVSIRNMFGVLNTIYAFLGVFFKRKFKNIQWKLNASNNILKFLVKQNVVASLNLFVLIS